MEHIELIDCRIAAIGADSDYKDTVEWRYQAIGSRFNSLLQLGK
jgi:hypothetical protein